MPISSLSTCDGHKTLKRSIIEGAINIDCTNEAFRDELDKLDGNKTYLIYAYCACGGVGWNALRTMEELGFKKVCNMWGGIGQWREEGLPTVE